MSRANLNTTGLVTRDESMYGNLSLLKIFSGRYESNYLVDRFPSFFLSRITVPARSSLIEIIFRLLRRLSAHSVILFRDETPAAAVFDLQEALVAVRHAVGAANRVVIRRTDLLAAAKQETLNTPLHRYHVYVFPGIKMFFLCFKYRDISLK